MQSFDCIKMVVAMNPCELAETVFAGGVTDVGEIAGHPALKKAHQMGKEI